MDKKETRGRKRKFNEVSVESKRYQIPASKARDFHEHAVRKIKEYQKQDKKN